jgi:hypothetical protein
MGNLCVTVVFGLLTLASAPAFAQYGGGSSYVPGFGAASSNSSVTTHVNAAGLDYTGTVNASAAANNTAGGFGSSTTTSGLGAGTGAGISITSTNNDQSFVKGQNSISVGVSTLTATQTVNGQTQPVAVDVGVAFSRATPFGSSAATAAFGVGVPSTHAH